MENAGFNSDSKINDKGQPSSSSQAAKLNKVPKDPDVANGSVELNSIQQQSHNSFSNTDGKVSIPNRGFFSHPRTIPCDHIPKKYSYVFRLKSRWELILLSGTVCGIEFCYAAETAYVTPVLLSLGLNIKFVTMIWCLSPLVGFFLTPILGSFSDTCDSKFGRRRPYILLLSMGILLGLILVPNGQRIGSALGDITNSQVQPIVGNNFQDANGSLEIDMQELVNLTDPQEIDYSDAVLNASISNNFQITNSSLEIIIQDIMNSTKPQDISNIDPILNTSNSDNLQNTNISLEIDMEDPMNSTEAKYSGSNDTILTIQSSNHSLMKRNIIALDAENNNHVYTLISNINKEMNSKFLESERNLHLRHKRFAEEIAENNTENATSQPFSGPHLQPWSLVFTVIGTVLLDSCSDACQSPSRAYLLDVCIPADHTAGLSTFTFMAGFGGTIGYLMGAMHWEATSWGNALGGQVTMVFIIITIIFIICLIGTLCSFPEIPLWVLRNPKMRSEYNEKTRARTLSKNTIEMVDSKHVVCNPEVMDSNKSVNTSYSNEKKDVSELKQKTRVEDSHGSNHDVTDVEAASTSEPTLKAYLKSIVIMPYSLRILCLTNLVGWMALVSYSLYFTDFVGECVYGGDPQAPEGSESYMVYKDGVRFACWGMALYSFSCSVYSYFIEALVNKIGAKKAYVGGQVAYAVGMLIMAISKHPAAVIILSPTAGIMYSSLFTIPYVLLAHYHSTKKFHEDKTNGDSNVRGMGTDVAIVSSMVFLSQFVLSLTMGSIVEAVGSDVATVYSAALLSAIAALLATQIVYYDT